MKTNYIKLLDGTNLNANYYYISSCGIVRRIEDGKAVGNTYSLEDTDDFIEESLAVINGSIKNNEEVKAIINHL